MLLLYTTAVFWSHSTWVVPCVRPYTGVAIPLLEMVPGFVENRPIEARITRNALRPALGKSTFFKALTLADVEIANYPFATIEPNEGFGHVRIECAEKFFGVKCNPRVGYCEDGQRFVPVKVIDVAGLVPGAHEGKGMGNQFLDDLNAADALIHVIDCAGTTNANDEDTGRD